MSIICTFVGYPARDNGNRNIYMFDADEIIHTLIDLIPGYRIYYY